MPRFTRLGASVRPTAISGDGTIVVGNSPEAFRWTRQTGLVALPGYMGMDGEVFGISGDGAYAVGQSHDQNTPLRWAGTSTPVNVGLPGGFTAAALSGANSNGSTLVGIGTSGTFFSTVWRSGSNPTYLTNAANTNYSFAWTTNGDGSVIVGFAARSDSGQYQAYRWTAGGGMVLLNFLPGGDYVRGYVDVSSDGNKIAGTSSSTGGVEKAFLWNSGTLTGLIYPGDGYAYGNAISGDGTTVVGTGTSGVWVSTNGGTPQLLGVTLAGLGADLVGFALDDVTDVSSNGKVIVGTGTPTGSSGFEGWIAILP